MSFVATLRNDFSVEMYRLCSMEGYLAQQLPPIIERATDPALRAALHLNVQSRKTQLLRLNVISKLLDDPTEFKDCRGIRHLVDACDELFVGAPSNEQFIDILIAQAVRRITQYEIFLYATARSLVEPLGEADIVALLNRTLSEKFGHERALAQFSRAARSSERLRPEPHGAPAVTDDHHSAHRYFAHRMSRHSHRSGLKRRIGELYLAKSFLLSFLLSGACTGFVVSEVRTAKCDQRVEFQQLSTAEQSRSSPTLLVGRHNTMRTLRRTQLRSLAV